MERGIRAIESLAQDPTISVEAQPPICPHCETVNPIVKVSESEAVGHLAEFVIQAQCQSCQNDFYAIPLMWDSVKTIGEVAEAIRERQEIGGYNQG